jgi:MFS family permease
MTTPQPPVPLRRNVRFQLLWIGAAASMLGSQLTGIAYPLLVLMISGSPAQAGMVAAAQLVGLVIMAVPAGPLVDRWDRRRILLGCEATRSVAVGTVAAAMLVGLVTVPHLIAVALVVGAGSALYNPARVTALRAIVPPEQLRPALAQEEVRTHAALLGGPPLGGVLFGVAPVLPFVVDAVSYLTSLACIAGARVPRRPRPAEPRPAEPKVAEPKLAESATAEPAPAAAAPGMAGQLAEALRWLSGQRFIRAVCAFSLVVNVVANGLLLPVIVHVSERSGSPAFAGVAAAMLGAGGLAGALVAHRISRLLYPGQLVLAFGWWFAVLLPLAALPLGDLWPGVVLALIGAGVPALNVNLQATVLGAVPDELAGRIGSLLMVASLGLAPLGPLLSGALTQAFGPIATLAVMGAVLAATTAAATVPPTLRRYRPPPAQSPEAPEAPAAEPALTAAD